LASPLPAGGGLRSGCHQSWFQQSASLSGFDGINGIINTPRHRLKVILGKLIASFGGAGSLGLGVAGLGHTRLGFVGGGGFFVLDIIRHGSGPVISGKAYK